MKHTVLSWFGIALAVLVCLVARGVRADGVASYVYVATNGNDTTGTGTIDNPYLTPSNGIAQAYATEGKDTVYFKKGLYAIRKALTLNKALTLKGEDRDTTIIKQLTAAVSWSEEQRVLKITSSDVRVESLSLRNGASQYDGGNINMTGGVITNCVLSSGRSSYLNSAGGNICMTGGLLTHCIISNGMKATYGCYGGGVAVKGKNVVVDSCLICNNDSTATWGDKYGGGIYLGNYTGLVVQNCTIVGNKAGYGGGIYSDSSSAVVRNCIIADNTVTLQASSTTGYPNMGAADAATWAACVSNIVVSDGTAIAELSRVGDPLFVGSGDYHLSSEDSPAVEYGIAYEGQCGDLEGKARKTKPDCGCYESDYHSQVVEQLFSSLSFTPEKGLRGITVSFAAELLDPPEDETFTATWKMYDAKGGEVPLSGTTLSFSENISTCGYFTVECSVKGVKNPKRTGKKQSSVKLHIVPEVQYVDAASTGQSYPYDSPETAAKAFSTVQPEILDGVTVYVAAGTYGVPSTVTLGDNRILGAGRDTTILYRSTTATGTDYDYTLFAMTNSLARISDLTLRNGTGKLGGSVSISDGGGTLVNCRIIDSRCGANGGYRGAQGAAVWCDSPNALVDHCLLETNVVNGIWGWGDVCGVASIQNGRMRNCVVCGNSTVRNTKAGTEALPHGIVYVGADGIVENCTIADNVDNSDDAEALCVADGGQVVNTVVARNAAPYMTTASGLYGLPNWKIETASAAAGVSHCCFDGTRGLGEYTWLGDPLFEDPDAANYRLRVGSPCYDHGVLADWMADATDFYDRTRVFGGRVDIGAAECQKSVGFIFVVR